MQPTASGDLVPLWCLAFGHDGQWREHFGPHVYPAFGNGIAGPRPDPRQHQVVALVPKIRVWLFSSIIR